MMVGNCSDNEHDGRRDGSSNTIKRKKQRLAELMNQHSRTSLPSSEGSEITERVECLCLAMDEERGTCSVVSHGASVQLSQDVSVNPCACKEAGICKPPRTNEIVILTSERSRQEDGMLRVTEEKVDDSDLPEGEEVMYKVDCKGKYDDHNTKLKWTTVIPDVGPCSVAAYLNMVDPREQEEGFPFRLCCYLSGTGEYKLAAHKVPSDPKDHRSQIYICHNKDKGGVLTLQENCTQSHEPLAGKFIGTTTDGELRLFPHLSYIDFTANPFTYFYLLIMEKKESSVRLNGEK